MASEPSDINQTPSSRDDLIIAVVDTHRSPAQLRQIRAGCSLKRRYTLVHSRYTFSSR